MSVYKKLIIKVIVLITVHYSLILPNHEITFVTKIKVVFVKQHQLFIHVIVHLRDTVHP
jgi:hypothetical protein